MTKNSSITQRTTEARDRSDGPKVGSDRTAAAHFADGADFGIPVQDAGRHAEAAEEAKYQPAGDHLTDPRPARSGSGSTREAGVGGLDSGPGSSSGGDLDTDFVGVGTHGTGIAMAGPDGRIDGKDMTDAASSKHTQNPPTPRKVMRGSTVDRSGGDDTTTGAGTGSSSLTPFASGDDAAAGEISQGEAGGDDNTDIDNMS